MSDNRDQIKKELSNFFNKLFFGKSDDKTDSSLDFKTPKFGSYATKQLEAPPLVAHTKAKIDEIQTKTASSRTQFESMLADELSSGLTGDSPEFLMMLNDDAVGGLGLYMKEEDQNAYQKRNRSLYLERNRNALMDAYFAGRAGTDIDWYMNNIFNHVTDWEDYGWRGNDIMKNEQLFRKYWAAGWNDPDASWRREQ